MKINKIEIPFKLSKLYGLKKVSMKRLDNVVLIAGKNGAGKTRLLKLIDATLRKTFIKASEHYDDRKSDLDKSLSLGLITKKEYYEDLGILQKTYRNDIDDLSDFAYTDYFDISNLKDEEQLRFIKLSTNTTKLLDSKSISDLEAENKLKSKTITDIDNYNELTSIYLKSIIKKKLVAQNKPKSKRSKDFNSTYRRLESEIKSNLGSKFDFDDNLNIKLFGLNPFSQDTYNTGLSEGQSILLQIITAKENLRKDINGSLILIDEPENYLYPENAIKYIQDIISLNPDGQTWILTHSIGILSSLDPSLIWYMENGEISYAGNIPRRTLNGLLGGEDNIARFENFIQLPAIMGANQFAYECLFDPQVLMTDKNDPQTKQVIESILNNIKGKEEFRILDFGCGKGRLFNAIYSNLKDDTILSQIEYYGYDISDDDKEDFIKSLNQHYSDSQERHIVEMDKLREVQDTSFDAIVLVNVLHEIHPDKWISLFNNKSPLYKLLKKDGYVLIVEDQHMHIGEKAHKHGFFLLDTLHLMKLFKFSKGNKKYYASELRNGRLKAHLLRKDLVQKVDSDSRIKCIESLRETSKLQINKLRADKKDFKSGKLIGLWLMQLANCDIYLDNYDL